MSEYVKVATVQEIKKTGMKVVSLMGKRVAIRQEGEDLYAIEVSCKHQGADLTTGKIEGQLVTCPRHGWQYDLSTGECLNQNSPPLRRHDLEVDGEDVRVALFPESRF